MAFSSLLQVLLEHISDCLWADWMGNDGVNVSGDLDSIGSLSSDIWVRTDHLSVEESLEGWPPEEIAG